MKPNSLADFRFPEVQDLILVRSSLISPPQQGGDNRGGVGDTKQYRKHKWDCGLLHGE